MTISAGPWRATAAGEGTACDDRWKRGQAAEAGMFYSYSPIGLITLIVGLVILYWVIRTAVRDGILAAWRIRKRGEKE